MQIGHAREHRRTARAHSVRSQRFVCGSHHFGVICEAEIIVGAEIDDRSRLAVVIDHRARICGREELGLVELAAHAPRRIQFVKLAGACSGSLLSPARKLLRLSFAGSSFIKLLNLSLARVSIVGVPQQS